MLELLPSFERRGGAAVRLQRLVRKCRLHSASRLAVHIKAQRIFATFKADRETLGYDHRIGLMDCCFLQTTPILLDGGRKNCRRDNQSYANYKCNDYGCVFHRILEWVVFSERHSDASRCSESAFDFWSGAGTDFPVSSPRRQRLVLPGFSLV